MEKFIQVKESVFVAKENLPFYEENNFIPLFDIGNEIINKLELIENMFDMMNDKHTSEIKFLETEAAKQQWYTNFLRDLTQANQALFGVMMLLNEKINV